ncbi:MAG: glycosyltransferase [Microthrixaceae bacterium]
MKLLRRFLLIGAAATLVDIGLLVGLRQLAGWPVPAADAVAVAAATAVSWCLHGLLTFPEDPSRRWYRSLGPYLTTAVLALVLDVSLLSLLYALVGPTGPWGLVALKLPALLAAFLIRSANYRRAMFDAVRDDQRVPIPRPPAPGRVRLTVVVPAYQEVDRIAVAVERIHDELAPLGSGEVEVVVVDDGSDDDTSAAARAAGADKVLRLEPNQGKGAAVRAGVLAATGRTVAFLDADLAYAPGQLVRFVDAVEAGWDVAVGSRKHTQTLTVVRARRLREVGGRAVNVLTGLVLLGRYRDTQCGLKAMRSDVGRLVFSHSVIDRFAFDVELFHLVERYRLTLVEVPVEVANSSRSTVRVVRDTSRLLSDLFAIRRRARLGGYEADPSELPPRLPPVSGGGHGERAAAH